VDRHIRSLRIKLQNDYRHPRFIPTVPRSAGRITLRGQPTAVDRHDDLIVWDLARTLDDRTRPSDVIGPIPTSAGS
jgi:hypothetical protein